LLTTATGTTLRLRNWRRVVFDRAVRAAGLTDVTPHDLRHTAASLAVASGATVKSVQRMLGHASAAITLDVYAGLFDDDLSDLAARMDAAAQEAATVAWALHGEAMVVHSIELRRSSQLLSRCDEGCRQRRGRSVR
jgi:site-specific recombinase XerC